MRIHCSTKGTCETKFEKAIQLVVDSIARSGVDGKEEVLYKMLKDDKVPTELRAIIGYSI